MSKIIVVGGGPGGYVAALKAAILGAEVTLIEKQQLGGTCLNRGCIPTKAYLSSTDFLNTVKMAGYFGISVPQEPVVDFRAIVEHKDAIVKQLVQGVTFLLKKRGVQVVNGFGTLLDSKRVSIKYEQGGEEIFEADHIILATGSVPVVPEMFQYDGKRVITSDEVLSLKELPKSMAIVGGGVVGCEFGQFFRKLGVEVTIIEMAEHIVPMEDREATDVLTKGLKKDKIILKLRTRVEAVEKTEEDVRLSLDSGEVVAAEIVLVSVGRKASVEGLGLEAAGVRTERGKILVDEKMETSLAGVYAIGDIVNSPLLAHVASREGCVAVENALGRRASMSYAAVPRCVYTEPEVAGVGLTEEEARARGVEVHIGKFGFAGIGKAMVMGKTEGFVKVLTDEADTIIGASIVGPHATELLTELTLAVQLGLTAKQLGAVIHPHPTLSETLMEALHDVHNESVHAF